MSHRVEKCVGCGKTATLMVHESGDPPWLCNECERRRDPAVGPKVRELLVTDIRCRAAECRAAPGERCKWNSRRSHQSRIDEHAQLVEAGWEWQEVDPTDLGAGR